MPAPDARVAAVRAFPTAELNVHGPNERTIELVRSSGARVYAEIGVYRGDTAAAVAELLAGEGELHLFDYEDRVAPVAAALRAAGHGNVVAHANSRRLLDSYNWSLMQVLAAHPEPLFDYVFLDGAHTWALDALAFCLIDRLLRPGGIVDFDDFHWTLGGSPSMRPEVFPDVLELYTDEQIEARQVALVVDLLVRRDARYKEIAPAKAFRKLAASA
jgi:predicted O-methyltransferase YrrM